MSYIAGGKTEVNTQKHIARSSNVAPVAPGTNLNGI